MLGRSCGVPDSEHWHRTGGEAGPMHMALEQEQSTGNALP